VIGVWIWSGFNGALRSGIKKPGRISSGLDDARRLSDLTLIYCGKHEIGYIFTIFLVE